MRDHDGSVVTAVPVTDRGECEGLAAECERRNDWTARMVALSDEERARVLTPSALRAWRRWWARG